MKRDSLPIPGIQVPPHQPYDVDGLPAAPPGRRDELPPSPAEFGVGPGVGGEQAGARVERRVLGVVEGGLEGAVDGAGRAHPAIVSLFPPPSSNSPGMSTAG